RRRHTRFSRDWSSDVCSSDLAYALTLPTNLMIFQCAYFCLAFLTDFSLDTVLRALQFRVFFLRFLLKHRLEILPMYLLKVCGPPVFVVCFELLLIQTLQKQPPVYLDFYPLQILFFQLPFLSVYEHRSE